MNKKIVLSLSIFLLLITLPVLAREQESYNKLQDNASNLYVDWDDLDAVPDLIRMTNLNIDWQSNNPEQRVYQFLEEYRELYKINSDADIRKELKIVENEQDDLGMTHITVQQEYQGIPVYAGKLKFHFRANGTISSINGTYLPDIPEINPEPSVSEEQAIEIAKEQVKQKLDLNDEDFKKLDLKNSAVELLIYNNGLFSKKREDAYLTWKVSVYSEKMALNKLFYINAHDSSVIKSLNNLFSSRDREVYVMPDCWSFPGTLTYDESGLVDTYDDQAELVYDYSGHVYDYYYNKFSRDSYDGNGGTLESITHYSETLLWIFCSDVDNAYWDPNLRLIKYGDNYITLDVVGHETTHGVINDTANLEYQEESGALNESYADVFGEFLEEYAPNFTVDWLHRTGHQDGVNRSLINPPDFNDPDHTDDQCDENNDYCGYWNDYGGVHTNSGIPNKVAYLIAVGGNHNNIQVNGIGSTAAEQIYYRTLSIYLGENSDFEDAYQNTMTACLDAYESDPVTYPISTCESVFQAFQAVGINEDDSFLQVTVEASPPDGFAPLLVDFDGSDSIAIDSNIVSYDWDFDDGNVGSGATISHAFTDSGSFDVVLTITDDEGNSESATYQLEVYNPIQPYFTFTGDSQPAPTTVDFDGSATYDVSGNITDYSWSYGDGDYESTGLSPYTSHEYTVDGYYNVILTVTDDLGYINTYQHSVVIGNNGPTYVNGSIHNDTWTANNSPYIITGSATVDTNGTLNIEEGVTIKFQSNNGYLDVRGVLNVVGTENDPVVFTSYLDDEYGGDANGDGNATLPVADDWDYIKFESGSQGSIDNAIIRYGGSYIDANAMIYIYSDDVSITNSSISDSYYHNINIYDASPTITNNEIFNSGSSHDGIYVYNYSSPTISNNNIYSNYIGIFASSNTTPTIDQNYVYDNYDEGIYVTSSDGAIVTDNTLDNNSYPLKFSIYALESSTVTGNTGSGNTLDGINVSGDSSGDVTLSNENDFPFVFANTRVSSGDTLTISPDVVVKFASGSYLNVEGNLDVTGTENEPVIFTSYLDDDYGGDINNDGNATLPAAGDWDYIIFESGSQGDIDNAIIRYGGSTLDANAMIYIYSDDVSITNSEISDSYYNVININEASPYIYNNDIFNSGSYSYGIYTYGGSSPTISNNEIYSNHYGIFATSSGTPTIDQNYVHDNNDEGIYVTTTDGAVVTDNTLDNNVHPLRFQLYALPNSTYTGNTGSGNALDAISISGDSTGDVTLNNENDFPFLFSSTRVSSGDTLTISPDVVVKFGSGSYLNVEGNLDVQGSEDYPVVFTSYLDDEYGGDINNDGNATLPAAEDWAYIVFASGSQGSIDNAIIRYGGSTMDSNSMIYIYSDDVSITNSTISDSYYNVMIIYDVSPTVSYNEIYNSGSSYNGIYAYNSSAVINYNDIHDNNKGISTSSSGSMTVEQNNIYDNTDYGIYSSTAITAENNYWGDATGPYNANNNPGGLGNEVNDNVDFDPWLTTPYDQTPPDDIQWRPPRPFRKDHWNQRIRLRWIPPGDADLDHYIIERFDGNNTIVLESNYTGLGYLDTNLSYTTPYVYTIYAVDDDGNQSSGLSSPVLVLKRPVPRNLAATAGNQQIDLTWNPPSIPANQIGGYYVYYGTNPNSLTQIDLGNTQNHTLTGLNNGTTYYLAASAYHNFNGQEGPRSPIILAVPTP